MNVIMRLDSFFFFFMGIFIAWQELPNGTDGCDETALAAVLTLGGITMYIAL